MFAESDIIPWEDTDPGVKRKIMAYDDKLMMVVVSFIKGSVGYLHSHPHRQVSYIVSGKFEVEINGEKKILKEGDSYFAAPNLKHGVVCLEEGKLIDVFTPVSEDFLKAKKQIRFPECKQGQLFEEAKILSFLTNILVINFQI